MTVRPSARSKRVIDFIERHCRVPEGKLVGQPIRLDPFQKKFIHAVYSANRKVRRAILSMARKNGKTALIACLLLVHLVGPEAVPNSQLVSGALNRNQAGMVFRYAVGIINQSEALSARISITPSSKKLKGLRLNTEYSALSADASGNHGLSPRFSVLDEVGQVDGTTGGKAAFFEAIETAQGAYDDALQITISTQAATDADLLSTWIDEAQMSDDSSVVVHLYAADEEDELSSRKAAKAANPALGSFRSEKEYEEKLRRAERSPSFEATFRRYYLNQRVNADAPFVAERLWRAGGDDPGNPVGPVYAGLDLARTTDLTAFVLTWRDEDGNLCVQPHFWMPGDTLHDRAKEDRRPYDIWADKGYINAPDGAVLDYGYVAADMARIVSGLDLAGIAYDPAHMPALERELDAIGASLPLTAHRQGFISMAPALNLLETDIITKRVRHGDHPVMNMCAIQSSVKTDPAGNRKLDKSRAHRRIDGMVALAMARGIEGGTMTSKTPASPWDLDPNFRLAS